MGRTWAIIERELRRFRRSPVLIVMTMVMPIMIASGENPNRPSGNMAHISPANTSIG